MRRERMEEGMSVSYKRVKAVPCATARPTTALFPGFCPSCGLMPNSLWLLFVVPRLAADFFSVRIGSGSSNRAALAVG